MYSPEDYLGKYVTHIYMYFTLLKASVIIRQYAEVTQFYFGSNNTTHALNTN